MSWEPIAAVLLFIATLACIQLGFAMGKKALANGVTKSDLSMNAIEAFAFSILGLILGFSFSYASNRFDARRDLIVNEANAVGTAYLRLDLIHGPDKDELKREFVNYIDTRLAYNEALGGSGSVDDALRKSKESEIKIWNRVISATEKENPSMRVVVLPPINEMFDVAASRTIAGEAKTPGLVIALIAALSLLCATLAGRTIAMHGWHHWTHRIVFAAVIAVTFLTILDLNDPRNGLIRLDYVDQLLQDTRAQVLTELGSKA